MKANLILLLGSVLLVSLLGELVLRSLGYYGAREATVPHVRLVDDPVLDFRGIPNSSWIYNNLHYRRNQHGWRDYDYSYAKPAGVFRILVLGDSVTNGHGISLEEIYAKRLERRLNDEAEGIRFQAVMLTIGALNTKQEVHLLSTEGLRYEPDLVMIGYVLNDPAPGTSLQKTRKKAAPKLARLKAAAKRSSLVFLTYRSGQQLVWRLRVLLGREEVADYIQRDRYTALHQDPESWQRVLAAFARLEELTSDPAIPVVVIVFPVLHRLDDYAWVAVHDQVARAARERGFHVLDLLPVFAGEKTHSLQVASGDHIHPNARGHLLAAEALHSFLRQRRLLG